MKNLILNQISLEELELFIKSAIKNALETQKSEISRTKRILNFEQACQFLNCSPSYLYKKTSLCEAPHFKKGKKLFFVEDELEQWLLNKKINTASETAEKADIFLNNIKSR